ncbi:hypothetical protein [Thiomonas sp.]|uniref:hypothetical protein n=1 Tax=Thiomonas sp. TaxID=2047785 RepID=UPI00262F7B67|nr:hypothetical protein [Thiomonas sp.]
MPYTSDPQTVRLTPLALRLEELWQAETRRRRVDVIALAQWWVDQLPPSRWAKSPTEPVGHRRQRWRQLARHVHLLAYVRQPKVIDAVAFELGIEGDAIPEPQITYGPDGRLQNVAWCHRDFSRSLAPYGFESWQMPLAAVGYVRPAWRLAPLHGQPDADPREAAGTWWG